MEFSDPKAIYLQLADAIGDLILQGVYAPGTKLPSVRDLAAEAGVNPNTIQRTISTLTDQGVLTNQRGVGTFVDASAREKIMEQRKRVFLEKDLYSFFQRISLLGLDLDDLEPLWKQWKEGKQVCHENQ